MGLRPTIVMEVGVIPALSGTKGKDLQFRSKAN